MSKKRKLYPLSQSPLYKIRGKGQLESALGIELARLPKLLARDNYLVWINPQQREIQQPIRWLGRVHQRIGELLSKIQIPDYVLSRKGGSYVDNAERHVGAVPLAKTDIAKFYPSTTRRMVVDLFVKEFQCAGDIAGILADICCYQRLHLPTGSPISGRIAYLAAKNMFDEINALAVKMNCRMTVYVDDVTISGMATNKRLISQVRAIIRKHGLRTKSSKTKTFPAFAPKPVTGAIVIGDEVKLPNVRHKKIRDARIALNGVAGEERKKLASSLRGRLQEAKQFPRRNRST